MNRTRDARVLTMTTMVPMTGIFSTRWAARILVTLLCITPALVLTGARIESMRLRYDINNLHKARKLTTAEIGRMNLELSNLTRPERIESLARQQGLEYPNPNGQIIGMDD